MERIIGIIVVLFTLTQGSYAAMNCTSVEIPYSVIGGNCYVIGTISYYYDTNKILYQQTTHNAGNNIDESKVYADIGIKRIDPTKLMCSEYSITSISGSFEVSLTFDGNPIAQMGTLTYYEDGIHFPNKTCQYKPNECHNFKRQSPMLSDKRKPISSNSEVIDKYCTTGAINGNSPSTVIPSGSSVTPESTTLATSQNVDYNFTTPASSYGVPQPSINCDDPNNSYIIKQACLLNVSSDPATIAQVTNETYTHIQASINNNTLNSSSVHDAGAFIFNTVTTVKALNQDGAHNILDITSAISAQPVPTLKATNDITQNSLLWYPASIHKIVALTETDLAYSKPDSHVQLHSFNLSSDFCSGDSSPREICYSNSRPVPSGDKNAEFCTTFDPRSLCQQAQKAYVTTWKKISFFAFVDKNPLNIAGIGSKSKASKTPSFFSWLATNNEPETKDPNDLTTYENAESCVVATYLKNTYGSGAGGVGAGGNVVEAPTTIWMKKRNDENNLHATNHKLASFVGDSFVETKTKVQKGSNHYMATCPQGTCAILVEGNPSDPIVCSSGVKASQGVISGAGIIVAACGILVFIFKEKAKALPIIGTAIMLLVSIFNDKNLPRRLKIFAYCYNATFMLYSLYILLFAEQRLINLGQGWCTFFAILGYILYISAIFLSIAMILITLDIMGCWKPLIKKGIHLVSGYKRIYFPFIYSYGFPLFLTLIFVIAMIPFFKRNDGYCWVRPDYSGAALWFPLILLLLSIPLYIILFARRWSTLKISKLIYQPLIIPEDFEAYEEYRKEKEAREKRKAEDDDDSGSEEDDGEPVILTNKTLARLMIPQLFLAVPLIAQNLAMYFESLTGWHYLFYLTQSFHLLVVYGIDMVQKQWPKLRKFYNWIKKKFTKRASDDDAENTVVKKKKKRARNNLPTEIEDFEPVVIIREASDHRIPNDYGNVQNVYVENESSGNVLALPRHSIRRTSTISIESNPGQRLQANHSKASHLRTGDSDDDISTKSLKSFAVEPQSQSGIVHALPLQRTLADEPLKRDPVEPYLEAHQAPSYIPLEQHANYSYPSSSEEKLVEEVLHPNLPTTQTYSDDTTNVIESLPDVEQISKFESDYKRMYELDKHGLHLLHLDHHLPLDLPFIRDSVDEEIRRQSLPSYIPFEAALHKHQSEEEEGEIVEEVLHGNLPSQLLPDTTSDFIDSLPAVEEISHFEPDYSEMYHFDKHGLHYLSPEPHLPLGIPFKRASVDIDIIRGRVPSYVPRDRPPSGTSSRAESMVEEVLEAVVSQSEMTPDDDRWIDDLVGGQDLPGYEIDMRKLYAFEEEIHLMAPEEHLPLDLPFIRESVEEDLARGRAPSYIPYEQESPQDLEKEETLVKEVLKGTSVEAEPRLEWKDGLPETFVQHPRSDEYSIEILVYQQQLPHTDFHIDSLLLPMTHPRHSALSEEPSIYLTPPETPLQSLATHPLRRASSSSDTDSGSHFPWFKSKTLRDEHLVGSENVIHSNDNSGRQSRFSS